MMISVAKIFFKEIQQIMMKDTFEPATCTLVKWSVQANKVIIMGSKYFVVNGKIHTYNRIT